MPETGSGGRRGGGVKDSLPFLKALENGHTLIKTFLNVYYDHTFKAWKIQMKATDKDTYLVNEYIDKMKKQYQYHHR